MNNPSDCYFALFFVIFAKAKDPEERCLRSGLEFGLQLRRL